MLFRCFKARMCLVCIFELVCSFPYLKLSDTLKALEKLLNL